MAVRQRIVVVGAGSIGKRHIRLLREREGAQVEVVEPNLDALASLQTEFGALVVHKSFEAMLGTHPEVVWLASPTSLHAVQSIAALNAGAHVFCEKPMAYTVEEARKVGEVVSRSSRIFNVGFYLHFSAGMLLLKEIIERGDLGSLLHIRAHVGSHITLVNSISRYQAQHAGTLFFDYSHQPDLLYWLTKKMPIALQVYGFNGGALQLTAEPNVADIICEYDSHLITHVHLNYVQMPERHAYEVIGDEGWAFLNFNEGFLLVGNRRNQTAQTVTFRQDRDDIFRAEHDAFFDSVEGKRLPETSAADGLISTMICAAALESYRTQQRVSP
ncbi:MAG: Gfo/Idh/MocA family oxidoreductase [Acidobacteria bacterium]|nr:Gfo/Idh/MocA family oxidoreductase [Acidobacteriota bacterium]